MSRSGYSDGCENLNLYRGTVARAAGGERGQAFFRDLVAALDAMPEKRLTTGEFQTPDGEVCALGALGRARGVDMAPLDPDDSETTSRLLGKTFDIAYQLAAETMYVNDEHGDRPDTWDRKHRGETPEQRWTRVRKWAGEQLRPAPAVLVPDGEETPRG